MLDETTERPAAIKEEAGATTSNSIEATPETDVMEPLPSDVSDSNCEPPLISLIAPPDGATTAAGSTTHYHKKMSESLTDHIYAALMEIVTKKRRYREPNITAKEVAAEIGTDPRYISAALRRHGDANFNAVINSLRLRDACKMMHSPRYANYSAEEIGLLSGFASRQAFYLAFKKIYNTTPAKYRVNKD